jgi:hydroxymethylbilane synthase
VARAIESSWPGVQIVFLSRSAKGDRDVTKPLASLTDKGAFTADLSHGLTTDDADLVVHSWKDLPLESAPGTTVAATLERADPRDVLLFREDVTSARPHSLRILSSSPRRAWLVERTARELLPWPVGAVEIVPVRGNVPTRLAHLLSGKGDALVVAKAALDRLLEDRPAFGAVRARVRKAIDACRWMVLPLRDVPGAPAQGALAIEVGASNEALIKRLREVSHTPTWDAVARERAFLASHGGGCHAALGATALPREYGTVFSAKAQTAAGNDEQWSLDVSGRQGTPADAKIWPRPDERERQVRRELVVSPPAPDRGLWVSRSEALPTGWFLQPDRIVWAAGGRTWRKLAKRGIWVHGCADGLGDGEAPNIDALAGRPIAWTRLTHADAARDQAEELATYSVESSWPADLADRTHLFWSSGTEFQRALAAFPSLRERFHASGPGRTARTISDVIGADRMSVWIDYDEWLRGQAR